ncbi:MAG: fibronectin type III domain-containing protein [Bacteroidales bacterium]|jgi:hypothetical protein|nr:fibronectin type III domain-containing protein [Bacteroidales bacterium]
MKKLFLIILISLFVFSGKYAFSAQPDMPILISVSVIPDAVPTTIEIKWIPSQDLSVEGYYIYKVISGISTRIDTVWGRNNNNYIFSYAVSDYVAEKYRIDAFDNMLTRSPMTAEHTTIQLDGINFEKCDTAVSINWSAYGGWNDIVKYRIYRRTDISTYQLIDSVSGTSLTYTDNSVTMFQNYFYYVEAISPQNNTATSNSINIFTQAFVAPAFLIAEYASVKNKIIEVKFSVDSTSLEVEKYVLKRRDYRSEGEYIFLEEFPFTGQKEIIYLDSRVRPNDYSYSYKLTSVTDCGVESAVSNEATTILLKVENDPIQQYTEKLSWTSYSHWDSGVIGYNIYYGKDTSIYLGFVDFTQLEYYHNISSILEYSQKKHIVIDKNFCYSVEAIQNDNDTSRIANISRSNVACASEEAVIYVPTAFNPISDYYENQEFRPIVSFIDIDSYELKILDKFGEIIFTSNEIYKGWDGKTKKGNYVAQEVYTYQIKYKDHSGRILAKTGTVAVIIK